MTESSESVLAGTKRPPFRLVVHAIREGGARLPIRPAVSEEFVVRSHRSKQNECKPLLESAFEGSTGEKTLK